MVVDCLDDIDDDLDFVEAEYENSLVKHISTEKLSMTKVEDINYLT